MRSLLPLLVLTGCASAQTAEIVAVSKVAEAPLRTADGRDAGVATLSQLAGGIRLDLAASNLPPNGSYGLHLHTTGRCDAPDFTTAGSHWNPTGRQHGKDNPAGAHLGDLPNLAVGADGRAAFEQLVPDATWEGLFDADGIALVIHEKADDYRSDPSGNSGKRIICGVFAPG